MSDTRERIYCVDCRWFRFGEQTGDEGIRYGKCAAVIARSNGEEFVAPIFEPKRPFASSARMTDGACGPDATKFEAKPAVVEAA